MTAIFKIALKTAESDELKTCDAIRHEGSLWLVTRWLENRALGIAKPERIIQLEPEWVNPSPLPAYDLILRIRLPESLFHLASEQITPAPFFSIAHPDITVELTSGQSNLH